MQLAETPAGKYVAAVADSVGGGFSRVLHAAQARPKLFTELGIAWLRRQSRDRPTVLSRIRVCVCAGEDAFASGPCLLASDHGWCAQ